ncbi:polyprenyl synthetase family protein [Actinacidiphila glaucinigra]|uniref:polyprenyl synthetase family protein n=1 Tax=Actinacidiphila glaucinigra TaxID=235986 RepID=UPI0033E12126
MGLAAEPVGDVGTVCRRQATSEVGAITTALADRRLPTAAPPMLPCAAPDPLDWSQTGQHGGGGWFRGLRGASVGGTAGPSRASALDLQAVRSRVDAVLDDFFNSRLRGAGREAEGPFDLAEVVSDFVTRGGKRLRPLLCMVGWHAGGKTTVSDAVLRTAASLELFHAFALIHDDIMDRSDLRRGAPTVHRAVAARYPDHPAREDVGTGAAILAGNLALVWSDELLHSAGLSAAERAAVMPVIDVMRTEIVYGQYLDLTTRVGAHGGVESALRVARYKTAKYTFERPLHLGAALAGAGEGLRAALSAFALPAGESFQLRDDLLGVFGASAQTGKPVLDDLRQAKPTVLMALAYQRADTRQWRVLDTLTGRPDLDEHGAEQVRRVLRETGAVDTVEDMIRLRHQQALQALAGAAFPAPAADAARRLVHSVAERAA